MKNILKISGIMLILLFHTAFAQDKLKVVTTLSTYADIARQIGGDFVDVVAIVGGDQDAHFVRPKPSYAVLLNSADIFITTGLDLELWAPTLVDMSRNDRIRSGQIGYVAAHNGINLLEKPSVLSRDEGDIHIYGNPHITTSPVLFKIIAENIAVGLIKNAPDHTEYFNKNLQNLKSEIDNRLFGEELVQLMGGDLLTKLALNGTLMEFLTEKSFQGKPMTSFLGGWLKKGLVFREKNIVAYHKNWAYFEKTFGIHIVGFVEPKPGIPPSPKHIDQLIADMRRYDVKVIIAANYFDEAKVRNICEKVGAVPVIVPMYVDGAPSTENIFKLTDLWIDSLVEAFTVGS